ncbi:MAG: VWA domain-containing protein [Candidatus Tantalella remota]|nr:VWA domain-containing protein [Candidatus Tantalella remota]
MIFRDPWILLFIPVLLAGFLIVRMRGASPGFLFPSDEVIRSFRGSLKVWLIKRSGYMRVICMVLVILALARPQMNREAEVKKEGIAIMLAIDTSSTMVADDLELKLADLAERKGASRDRNIKRIDAAKEVAADFIGGRQDDLVGIVAFAAHAFVVCPLTFDHEWLEQSLSRVKVGMIKDGTAIGSGILSCLNSLKDAEAKSKIIILITDGINNFGKVPPQVAAKAARSLGIKIYTIGLASKGHGLYLAGDGSGRRVYKNVQIDVDEKELKKIADLTDGQYFRARDMQSLKESYKEIDKLEKAGLEEKSFEEYVDVFQYFLITAFFFLMGDIVLRNTLLRRIP